MLDSAGFPMRIARRNGAAHSGSMLGSAPLLRCPAGAIIARGGEVVSGLHGEDVRPVLLAARLKADTAFAHQQTEARVDIAGSITNPAAYRRWLARSLALYRPLEHRLAPQIGNSDHDWLVAGLGLSAAIASDLQSLGVDPWNIPDAPTSALPALDTEAGSIGCLYVLEGSKLGGRIIRRQLMACGIADAETSTFLQLGGDDLGRNWQEFRCNLDRYGAAHPERIGGVIDGSIATFKAVAVWLDARAWRLG